MEQKRNWLERPIHPALPSITNEIVIFAAVILLAIVTRFYDLGTRVMSHDESLHTYFSWLLYRGQGYEHSPMMHGPLQFHMIALSYFLFGASDFTSRIPAALAGIATIWMVWYWRRYLGKWGALIAGFLMVISPYMLYYSRYVRNESYTGLAGVIMLYAILRHLEAGGKKYIYMFAAAMLLHFLTKETAFIYAAQALLFFVIYFIAQVTRRPWQGRASDYRPFIIALGVAILLVGAAAGYGLYTRDQGTLTGAETAAPADPLSTESPLAPPEAGSISPTSVIALAGILAIIAAAFFLIRGYTWGGIRSERSFDLLMLTGMIVLPMLSPFPVKWLERWLHVSIPAEAAEVQNMLSDPKSIWVIGGFLVAMFIVSAIAGLIWNKELWWKVALVFWVPYTIFFTTVFTNSDGFFTGSIGSLGYWIVQQGVERGSQPWYYYILIQIPVYEFLPALGLFLALILGLRRRIKPARLETSKETEGSEGLIPAEEIAEEQATEEANFPNTFSLLTWWSFTIIIALSLAGERMPWLTYHMAWPMILITGWALGHIVETTDWQGLCERRAPLVLATTAIFITSIMGVLLALTGPNPPFQGKELVQLQATSAFLLPAIVAVISAFSVTYLLRDWGGNHVRHVFTLTFFALLAVLTARAAFRASYITYDQPTEFLVYAHGATGIKEVISQAQEISERTTGGMGVALAYDASAPDTGVSWPFVWYLRDFTDQRSFDQPTRSLRDSTVVIVDQKNFDKIEPALGPGYYRIDYIRMWWPMQDYFNVVTERDPGMPFDPNYSCKGLLGFFKLFKSKDYSRFCSAFTDPNVRAGIIQIWMNRDYTLYAQATGRGDLTLTTWQPADQMRLYIRKDVASQIWNYGVGPSEVEDVVDPTEGKVIALAADVVLDAAQEQNPVNLNAPRSLAFASNGTFYAADSRNHRIVHLDVDGKLLQEWGSFADGVSSPADPGTFNEPWGVAVGPDGSVYVTDTWNHRVQKFTATGKFIKQWGFFGQGETPDAFYGPRGIAVDSQGRVYVTDTGNKRIVVFDADGNFIAQFGSAGLDNGQFDEPVGVAVDKEGMVYVTDTWNQRVQTFFPSADGTQYIPAKQWDVYGWFGQSLENKPFIAVNDAGHVFITDPEGYRVMEFDVDGQLVRVWGDLADGNTAFGLASGIAVDPDGHVWVTDGLYNRVLRFTLP
ncbi:MAG: TIGR03663 family protein [Chloroflexi bacterium]|nr:TIGR03663 family protein [Chloroflexota bacterium]